jgi:hypothetical protein
MRMDSPKILRSMDHDCWPFGMESSKENHEMNPNIENIEMRHGGKKYFLRHITSDEERSKFLKLGKKKGIKRSIFSKYFKQAVIHKRTCSETLFCKHKFNTIFEYIVKIKMFESHI